MICLMHIFSKNDVKIEDLLLIVIIRFDFMKMFMFIKNSITKWN